MEDGCTLPSSDDNPSSEDNQFVEAEMELFLPNLETSDLQHHRENGRRLAGTSNSLKAITKTLSSTGTVRSGKLYVSRDEMVLL